MFLRRLAWLPALVLLVPACEGEPIEEEVLDPDGPPPPGGKADQSGRDWPAMSALPAACDLEPTFRALFAPDDPTVTLELALIDKIRAARKADPATYSEGKNPYRIRYAVYNLGHSEIVARLFAAEKGGVDVQVLIEADQLFQWWNDLPKLFTAAGLEVVKDYKKIAEASRPTADLVGISEYGLMHLKARLFEMPGWSALLTGSMNPNQAAGANEENLHLIRDPRLIAQYSAAYDAVYAKKPLANEWQEGAALNVLFSPAGSGPRASTKLLEWVDGENEQILLMVFSFRDLVSPAYPKTLVQILTAKAAAGVPVYVITDRKQSDGIDIDGKKVATDDKTEDKLRQAGVHVYEAMNTAESLFGARNPYAAMHHKAAVLGRSRLRVITDAANWTLSALGNKTLTEKNVESMLFIDSAALDGNYTGRRYLAQWLRVLYRYAPQSAMLDRELGAEEVATRLLAGGTWPNQGVSFVADKAETQLGENIFVVGGADALGRWGQGGAGLPLRVRFEWKLVARNGGSARWEGGDNRVGFALPAICRRGDNDAGEQRGEFR